MQQVWLSRLTANSLPFFFSGPFSESTTPIELMGCERLQKPWTVTTHPLPNGLESLIRWIGKPATESAQGWGLAPIFPTWGLPLLVTRFSQMSWPTPASRPGFGFQ